MRDLIKDGMIRAIIGGAGLAAIMNGRMTDSIVNMSEREMLKIFKERDAEWEKKIKEALPDKRNFSKLCQDHCDENDGEYFDHESELLGWNECLKQIKNNLNINKAK